MPHPPRLGAGAVVALDREADSGRGHGLHVEAPVADKLVQFPQLQLEESSVGLDLPDDLDLSVDLECCRQEPSLLTQGEAVAAVETYYSLDVQATSSRLSAAKIQAWRRRWRISGPSLVFGTVLMLAAAVLYVTTDSYYGTAMCALVLVGGALGSISLLLAILPSDRCITAHAARGLLVLDVVAVFFHGWNLFNSIWSWMADGCRWSGTAVSCAAVALRASSIACCVVYSLAAVVPLVRVACKRPMANPLRTLWRLLAGFWVSDGLSLMVTATAGLGYAGFRVLDLGAMLTGISLLLVGFSAGYWRFRSVLQAWLAARGEDVGTAAGISELLGGTAVDRVMSEARVHFRCISCDKVMREDMEDRLPNSALFALTEKAKFGQVDAFVSHSWHDDAEKKWAALQAWRAEFRATFGREPRLWIDKYCIDQDNIEASLRCLPLYLAGCDSLVALCGTTYTTRLWCLVEIFVFLEMSSGHRVLDVIRLSDEVDLSAVQTYSATATTAEDTVRLRGVLEAACGEDGLSAALCKSPRLLTSSGLLLLRGDATEAHGGGSLPIATA